MTVKTEAEKECAGLFRNKVIAITGAGGVICGSLAEELGKEGAKLALLDLKVEGAQKVADKINAAGGKATAYQVNVLDKASLEAAHEKILAELGLCDALINGAGGNNPLATTDNEFCEIGKQVEKDFFSLDTEGVKFVFDLNIIGTFLPTQVFAEDMISRNSCCILNISSMNAFTPLTKIPAYSAAKAGVSNFTQWLAVHFAKCGIRVNAIAPGFFVTNQNRALLYDAEGNPTARTHKILNATPMGRFGEVSELTGAVKFLLDEKQSGFVTGVILPIDGGFNAYSGV